MNEDTYENCPVRVDLFRAAFEASTPDGLVLEFGVSSGSSIQQIANLFGRPVYGFDSWEGLPEDDFPGGWPDFKKGAYRADKQNLGEGIILIDGWFKDSLPGFVKEHPEPARFVNIDCDIYSSTKDVLDHIIVKSGTVFHFDEFKNYTGWERREYKAFQEFIERTGYHYEYIAKWAEGGNVVIRLI